MKKSCIFRFSFDERQYQLGNEKIHRRGDSPIFEIAYWNFQHMLHLWFREASQNLSSFRQLFFIVSKGGPKEKCWKIAKTIHCFFSIFPLVLPLGNYEKKSCLNELKFWEASRNQKWSICWKFQLFVSLGTQKEPHVGIHISESCSPLSNIKSVQFKLLNKILDIDTMENFVINSISQ